MATEPELGNGKICYLDMPALDIQQSADFYKSVFGWTIRTRGDGNVAFNDGVNQVSGTWSTNRKPSIEPGILIYIMVDDIAKIMELVKTHGGTIVQPLGMDAPEITARFSDPAGNILGLFQQ